jgi:hypothetical protein
MQPNQMHQAEFRFLLENAKAGKVLGVPGFLHLDQPIGIWNYIRIADDIVRRFPQGRFA